MGRMKEEFMSIREQQDELEQAYDQELYYQEQEQLQSSINQNNLKMKKVNVQEAIMVKETREEKLRRLFIENGLVKGDVHKRP